MSGFVMDFDAKLGEKQAMEIAVFGAGYVGLVQAAGLASTGNKVHLIDVKKERVEMLRSGKCPIFEPGLEALLQAGASKAYLDFVHTEDADFKDRLNSSEIYFLAVQTPEGSDGIPKLDYLYSAVDMLNELEGDLSQKIVVTKSTVPVGTGDELDKRFQQKGKKPIVASNPEFLKQGSAVQDFLKPERVVIGAENSVAFEVLGFLHRPFMMKRERIVCMGRRSAELVKYACNSFLAVKISFINEMARLAETLGANIQEVREGMITDSRIGEQFLYPGIGYGGSCLPKDTHALVAQARAAAEKLGIIESADEVNRKQRLWPLEKLKKRFGDLKSKKIALWGLSFKPNTDDLREAASIPLVKALLEHGAEVFAHDPAAMKNFSVAAEGFGQIRAGLKLVNHPYEAIDSADALVIVTEWQEYRTPNFNTLKEKMRTAVVVDGRNIYDFDLMKKKGFDYYAVGVSGNSVSQ